MGDVLDTELDKIMSENDNNNKQIQALAQVIDDSILSTYKLWPTNFIAYDLINNTNQFSNQYTEKEKQLFERRLEMRLGSEVNALKDSFLAMYANPVVNKLKYQNVE